MKLLEENDPFLKTVQSEFDLSNMPAEYKEISNQMIEIMYENLAIGLAAPQLGLPWRMFVMHTSNGPKICINPKILKVGDIKPTKEGCLSFPKLQLVIHRPNFIMARYYDIDLTERQEYFDGIEAVCFQHELDHLDGELFVEMVSNFQLKNALKKRNKQTS